MEVQCNIFDFPHEFDKTVLLLFIHNQHSTDYISSHFKRVRL